MEKEERWWTVKLLVPDADLVALSGLGSSAMPEGARHVRFAGLGGQEGEDPASLTFELQAGSFDEAEDRAQGFTLRMRRAARLPDAVVQPIWVAPLGPEEGAARFFEEAAGLIAAGSHGLAVVAAQIYFEVQLRALLEEAAAAIAGRWAARLVSERSVVGLTRDSSLAAVELLLGIDVTQMAGWERFRAHLDRRNDVAHKGQAIGQSEARDSLDVVREFWTQLAERSRSHPPAS